MLLKNNSSQENRKGSKRDVEYWYILLKYVKQFNNNIKLTNVDNIQHSYRWNACLISNLYIDTISIIKK